MDGIQFVSDPPMAAELLALLAQTNWGAGRDEAMVEAMIAGTSVHVCARDGEGRLVGYARALTDGAARALVEDVVVDAAHRRQGVGGALLSRLDAVGHVELTLLLSGAEQVDFYRRAGFSEVNAVALYRKGRGT